MMANFYSFTVILLGLRNLSSSFFFIFSCKVTVIVTSINSILISILFAVLFFNSTISMVITVILSRMFCWL